MLHSVLGVALALLAAVLGSAIGYTTAGVGGAALFAFVAAVGGMLLGRLITTTGRLALHAWPFTLATVGLVLFVLLTWGVRL